MNKNLNIAKEGKADEFYTLYENVENELVNYKQYFKDKVVYCNADDFLYSNFHKFFVDNFAAFGLKKLITTGMYADHPGGLWATYDGELRTGYLKTGDFRSPECIEFLKEADVVVTNPPFSLFRDFINLMDEYNKNYLVLGNMNAITYKDIFKLIHQNKLWIGYNTWIKWFQIPDRYPLIHGKVIDGKKYVSMPNVIWFTNLPVKKSSEDLGLYLTYEEGKAKGLYPKYDNYDAINVDKVKEIPIDYFGPMGVPITFLLKWTKDYDIVRFRKGDDERDLDLGKKKLYFRIIIQRHRNQQPQRYYGLGVRRLYGTKEVLQITHPEKLISLYWTK